jgi:hypothetical protein
MSYSAHSLRAALLPAIIAGLAFPAACIIREAQEPEAAGEGATDTSAAAPLPAPTQVMSPDGIRAFQPQGTVDRVKFDVVPVEGQPFTEALQMQVLEGSETEWSVQAQTKTTRAVEAGEVLLASFYARVSVEQEEGGGESQFVFELAQPPWPKAVTYSFRLTPEWRLIQIPFTATQSFGAGDAQILFRLGYEPETLQVGGITVDSYGTGVNAMLLPNTKAADQKLANKVMVAPKLEPVPGGELAISVEPSKVIRPISRWVYGINSQKIGDTRATVRRNGGNRGTAYNWEINASNAGKDYQHNSDDWPCTTMDYRDCDAPGAQFIDFIRQNALAGADSIVTVPMLDWVAADKKGPVSEAEAAPSPRFLRSVYEKPTPFSDKPDLNDGVVYEDEFVHALVKRFGTAAQGGPKFYSLDNEPALWPETHPRIHPEHPTYEEVLQRSESLSSAITAVDPSANVLGGVMFGWSEYESLSSAPDAEKYNEAYGNYVKYYLAGMHDASKRTGRRLLHALDIHWYPEARGTKRITDDDASAKTIDARLQAPRSLWDASYIERSWITQQTGKPIRLLRWFQEMIAERFPGTNLTMTEYNFGGTKHVSGGLTQIDVLGVFGREGVFMSNYWGNAAGVGDLPPYIAAAFRMYRNYDGKGGKFGDVAVVANSPNQELLSVFAATDAKNAKRLTIIVINKHQQNIYDGAFDIGAAGGQMKAQTFVLDSDGTDIAQGPDVPIASGKFRFALQPLSATLFVCE